jgi:hypothetical protein
LAEVEEVQTTKSARLASRRGGLYGFHQVHVQPGALGAYKAGKGYAEGDSMVVPFYDVREGGGAFSQGPLQKVLLMKRDAKASATGGWTFVAFDAAGQLLPVEAKTACFDCHAPSKDRDFVFSQWE